MARRKVRPRGKDGDKSGPVCIWCKRPIDPVIYGRGLLEGVSYAVCGEDCPKWQTGAIFIGWSGS